MEPHIIKPAQQYKRQGLLLLVLSLLLPAIGREIEPNGADLGNGVQYRHLTKKEGPLSIHVLEISRHQPDLRITASIGASIKGKNTVPDMVSAIPPAQGVPLAAINGGFFERRGEPLFFGVPYGLSIIDGELLHGPQHRAICFDGEGHPSVRGPSQRFSIIWPEGTVTAFGINSPTADYASTARIKTVPISLFTPRFADTTGTEGIRELILEHTGEGPWLPLSAGQTYQASVREVRTAGNAPLAKDSMVLSISRKAEASTPSVNVGDVLEIVTDFNIDMSDVMTAVNANPLWRKKQGVPPEPTSTAGRAPRTLVGFNDESIFFVVVDGRQPELSVGMNWQEIRYFLYHELGCTDIVTMDGGGSSTFWLQGKVMNSPSGSSAMAHLPLALRAQFIEGPRAVADCLVLMRLPVEDNQK